MKGHVLLSHGLESGPQASKVTAMAAAAEARGWRTTRPDFRDLDATGQVRYVDQRIERLCAQITPGEPLVLAGSSLGAFASGLASLRTPPMALYLLAPPLALPGYGQTLDLAPVPTAIVHGWRDELIPASQVIDFARARALELTLVDDSHRLERHVQVIADWFGQFLDRLA